MEMDFRCRPQMTNSNGQLPIKHHYCTFTCFTFLHSQIFIFHNVTITYPENFTQCTTRGSFATHWQETAYNMFTFSCLFLLPLVIMIVCYTRIFIQISKRMTKTSCEFSAEAGVWLLIRVTPESDDFVKNKKQDMEEGNYIACLHQSHSLIFDSVFSFSVL